jgi:hypothetical protein
MFPPNRRVRIRTHGGVAGKVREDLPMQMANVEYLSFRCLCHTQPPWPLLAGGEIEIQRAAS